MFPSIENFCKLMTIDYNFQSIVENASSDYFDNIPKIKVIETSLGSSELIFPQIQKPKMEQTKLPEPTPIEQSKPKPTAILPDEENEEDDGDDLDKIKGEIMKTLSKLEEAEVE